MFYCKRDKEFHLKKETYVGNRESVHFLMKGRIFLPHWSHLFPPALVKGAGRSVQFRQLQLYRHEMQHFVKVIQGYIANQILQVSWSEFTAKLATASDLDAIHRTHADYLNRAIFRWGLALQPCFDSI